MLAARRRNSAQRWRLTARPEQIAPAGPWRVWLFMGGRGAGKTRAGAEWIHEQVRAGRRHVALVAPTAADARDVMIEGPSGILSISWNDDRPLYEPSKRRLTWPNGAVGMIFSADEPERLRGPQHEALWADELGAWRYPEAWDQAMFGLRLGADPRAMVTTTPRPTPLIRKLLEAPTTVVTRSTTYANRANLAAAFFSEIIAQYEGTRLGRQELNAELLTDVPGALWKREWLDATRVRVPPAELARVVVAIDPAATSADGANETGIISAGLGADQRGYVLGDHTLRGTPAEWAAAALAAYAGYQADAIVIETNQGGEMCAHTLRMAGFTGSIVEVHASRGKATRAEPVSALYEQSKVSHVGVLAQLEDQLCNWTPGQVSPDRLDALVWALTALMVQGLGRVEYAPSIYG